jgi:hypothetical protein
VSDFCYSWPVFERVFRQAELMDRMLERIGAAPAVAARIDQGMAWYVARTMCIECLFEHQCRGWLANAGATEPPDFCPNAPFFRRCAEGTRHGPAKPYRTSGEIAASHFAKVRLEEGGDTRALKAVEGLAT